MSEGLNEDELITLRAICWLSNRLWQQYFDEAKTIYEHVLALAQLPGEHHYLWDVSWILDKTLRLAKHERAQARRLLLSLVQELEKLLRQETHPEIEVWGFTVDGGPPIKLPPLVDGVRQLPPRL